MTFSAVTLGQVAGITGAASLPVSLPFWPSVPFSIPTASASQKSSQTFCCSESDPSLRHWNVRMAPQVSLGENQSSQRAVGFWLYLHKPTTSKKQFLYCD